MPHPWPLGIDWSQLDRQVVVTMRLNKLHSESAKVRRYAFYIIISQSPSHGTSIFLKVLYTDSFWYGDYTLPGNKPVDCNLSRGFIVFVAYLA